jgi:hypothetical protein
MRMFLTALAIVLGPVVPVVAASMEDVPRARGGCAFAGHRCAIRVNFGSVCCGPDRETGANVSAYIAASNAIAKAYRCVYGREGDYEICLAVPSKAKTRSVFDALQSIIPEPGSGPSSRGTTSIVFGAD